MIFRWYCAQVVTETILGDGGRGGSLINLSCVNTSTKERQEVKLKLIKVEGEDDGGIRGKVDQVWELILEVTREKYGGKRFRKMMV